MLLAILPEGIKKRLRFMPRIVRNQFSLRLEREYYNSFIWRVVDAACSPIRMLRRREVGQNERQSAVISALVERLGNKRNIVFINSYFPPNDFGGSTKVLVNQIEHLKTLIDPDISIWVIAAAPTELRPFEMRLEEVNDINVLGIGTPLHPRPEWHYIDTKMLDLFSRIFAASKPTLVHAHSVQRLTAAPLIAANKCEIPYYITLHDAWWINDEQFRLSGDGIVIDRIGSSDAALDIAVDKTRAEKRLAELAEVLTSATKLISVSRFQHDLYLDNGYESTIIENGVDIITPPIEHQPSEYIRFLYAGGIAVHKGYYLLRDAIAEANLPNWRGTVVDFALSEPIEQYWGTTLIKARPQIANDEWRDIWQETDVVIVPSLVDESYGLLSREAQRAGCAVIVSNSGALPESVNVGKTGWVFTSQDQEALVNTLRLADKQLPLVFDPTELPIATGQDAAEELIQLYQPILNP